MKEFPEFMRSPKNRIKQSSQYTEDIEGYVFDGADGSQMAFWTCYQDRVSDEHVHEYDEYLVCIDGQYKVRMNRKTLILNPGDEFFIPAGTVHGGESIAGTRTIHAFGGRRVEREDDGDDIYGTNAVEWAKLCLNSTDYVFKCLAFVEDALERSNQIEIFGGDSAKESADLYEASKHKDLPPKGAFVFYECSGPIDGEWKDWGHVGMSLGNGEIIHAWDRVRIDHYLEVESLDPAPGWEKPKFIGWVPLRRVMAGHRLKKY